MLQMEMINFLNVCLILLLLSDHAHFKLLLKIRTYPYHLIFILCFQTLIFYGLIILQVLIISLNFQFSLYSLKICNQVPISYKIFNQIPKDNNCYKKRNIYRIFYLHLLLHPPSTLSNHSPPKLSNSHPKPP